VTKFFSGKVSHRTIKARPLIIAKYILLIFVTA
jgi:hypothetical protein